MGEQFRIELLFGLAIEQVKWLRYDLTTAHRRGQIIAVFMHAYPSEHEEGAELATLFMNVASRPLTRITTSSPMTGEPSMRQRVRQHNWNSNRCRNGRWR